MNNFIKKVFNIFGLNLSRVNAASVHALQTVQALKAHDINVVFDVGANIGQFANELRKYGYTGKIISFEPLPQAYEEIVKRAKRDANWTVHPRCAVGEKMGEIKINVAANSVSSSILSMLTLHENVAPESKYTDKESASLITLDSVYELYCKPNDKVFLKIDTQGYEMQVLEGASVTLDKCNGISIEMSLVPLYSDWVSWRDMISRLESSKYHIFAIQPNFIDLVSGQTLQVDGLFFK